MRSIALWIRSASVDRWWHDPELWRAPGLEGLWLWDDDQPITDGLTD